MKDGGLRTTFRLKFPGFQWTSVETAGTATGVPDSEFCSPEGVQGWIEFKKTHANAVDISPFQVAWLMRRCRYGGNAWIAVRRIPKSQRETGVDQLWFMRGGQAKALFEGGLDNISGWCWSGGESNWNFAEIHDLLHGLHS
jgi:hypothetical protein